jgi:hypothetical protein
MEEKQKLHAEKIRTERALMDLSGASRTQIRAGLRAFKQQLEVSDKQKVLERDVVQQPAFTPMATAETKFEAKTKSKEGAAVTPAGQQVAAAAASTPTTGTVVRVMKFENGTLYFYNVLYTTREDVPFLVP